MELPAAKILRRITDDDVALFQSQQTLGFHTEGANAVLPAGVQTVRASAVAADGSLWMVADVEPAPGEQPIKGERDVALMKYDPSGRLVATRMLGAADEASGYAIAILPRTRFSAAATNSSKRGSSRSG